jgi:hypothetical protein
MSYIYFRDYHHDGDDQVVECTADEWDRLIAPTKEEGLPIDCATVDEKLLDELLARDPVDLTLSQIDKIEWVVPLV